MDVEDRIEEESADVARDLSGVYRYYELAKRAEWQVRDLPWGELPPIPEYSRLAAEARAGARTSGARWSRSSCRPTSSRCEMATQLFAIAPDPDAKLYYTTMVQDESRHTEAWLKLIDEVGGTAERDPYLDELAHMTLDAETLEEKVFLMQVFYERLIIPRFRHDRALLARHGARGSVQPPRRSTTASTTAPAWRTSGCCSRARGRR